MKDNNDLNGFNEIIAQVLEEIKKEQGSNFSLDSVYLAEMQRLTSISRARLRRLKKNGFVVKPDGRSGRKAAKTKLTGYTDIIDAPTSNPSSRMI